MYGDRLFIAGSTGACMYSFSIDEIMDKDNNEVRALEKIDLKRDGDFIRVSFTSVDQELLYAGEFHKGPLFYTDNSHWVTTKAGCQKAYLVGFSLSGGRAEPKVVYSIPDDIQGACFADGYVFLSKSRGFLPGEILAYPLKDLGQQEVRKVLGCEVPLFCLTRENAEKITTVPPMPEELTESEGRLYIAFEAASNRYRIGRLLGLDKVYSTPLDYFRNK